MNAPMSCLSLRGYKNALIKLSKNPGYGMRLGFFCLGEGLGTEGHRDLGMGRWEGGNGGKWESGMMGK
jgi:hypothetical protein